MLDKTLDLVDPLVIALSPFWMLCLIINSIQ